MDHAEARERLADALLAPRDGGAEPALAGPGAPGGVGAVGVRVAGLAGGLARAGQRQEADRQVAELGDLMAATQAILADPAFVRIDLAGPGGRGRGPLGSPRGRRPG